MLTCGLCCCGMVLRVMTMSDEQWNKAWQDAEATANANAEARAARTASTERKETASSEGTVRIGGTGVLRIPGQDNVLVAVSNAAHDRMIELAVAGDDVGTAQLVLAGQAYVVPAGTSVRVIDRSGFGVREVRIMSGEHFGANGFVSEDFICPQ